MFRAALLGVVTTDAGVAEPFIVFEGGPKSLGDELIVLTSRFFAEPENVEILCFRKNYPKGEWRKIADCGRRNYLQFMRIYGAKEWERNQKFRTSHAWKSIFAPFFSYIRQHKYWKSSEANTIGKFSNSLENFCLLLLCFMMRCNKVFYQP